jgi:hypothetical protein
MERGGGGYSILQSLENNYLNKITVSIYFGTYCLEFEKVLMILKHLFTIILVFFCYESWIKVSISS